MPNQAGSKALVTGSAGMLGAQFCRALMADHEVVGVDRAGTSPFAHETVQVDITDEFAVRRMLERHKPDLIVHCAAIVDVDSAEEAFEDVRAVNALGTRNLARHAPSEAKLVYISTDSVFDGRRGMYVETDLPSPLNAYAKTKLEGEWFVGQERENHLICRTNFFGKHHDDRSSFAEWVVDSLKAGQHIRMVEDWWFSPIYSEDLVAAVLAMASKDLRGLYHVAGSQRCSKLEFGQAVAKAFDTDASLIESTRFGNLSFRAPRPQDMSLDCSKAQRDAGITLPGYVEGIEKLAVAWAAGDRS